MYRVVPKKSILNAAIVDRKTILHKLHINHAHTVVHTRYTAVHTIHTVAYTIHARYTVVRATPTAAHACSCTYKLLFTIKREALEKIISI